MAIACQGGGSHTAFTAGVLRRLLGDDQSERHRVVGLSGTSGGAICALMAWHGLLHGDRASARRMLDEFWAANSASAPPDRLLNAWTVWMARMADSIGLPAISPYHTPASNMGLDILRQTLQDRIDFDAIGVQPAGSEPVLVIGAVDVLSGDFRTFNSRRGRITADEVLASAAIPNLFPAVHADGGVYWDGLFSQNPPVRELLDELPDEVWVIQINPTARDREPTTVSEIADRRNELAGNLSLHQELHFIERIDAMLESGLLAPDGKYRPIVVRVIELSRSRLSRHLGTASKLNRDPAFIRGLVAHGQERAQEFLDALAFEDAWRRRHQDAILDLFADDALLESAPPFPDHGSYRGSAQIRRFVEAHLGHDVVLDLTRKQLAGDKVAWAVSVHRGDRASAERGRAEAVLREGRVVSLRLTAGGVV